MGEIKQTKLNDATDWFDWAENLVVLIVLGDAMIHFSSSWASLMLSPEKPKTALCSSN